jgi:N-formylglutamate amidohydrolase
MSGVHAIQIEINRALYMDERTLEPHAGFGKLERDMRALAAALVDLRLPASGPWRTAAE